MNLKLSLILLCSCEIQAQYQFPIKTYISTQDIVERADILAALETYEEILDEDLFTVVSKNPVRDCEKLVIRRGRVDPGWNAMTEFPRACSAKVTYDLEKDEMLEVILHELGAHVIQKLPEEGHSSNPFSILSPNPSPVGTREILPEDIVRLKKAIKNSAQF